MTPAEARAAMLAEGALELRNGQLDLTPQGQRALDAFLAELPTLQKMFDVFTRHPTLMIEGYDRPDRPGFTESWVALAKAVDQFERALAWLRQVPTVKTPQHEAYWTKHQCQRWAGGYVSPGALLCAALHLSVPVRLDAYGNAFLGLCSYRKWPGWPK